MRSARPTQKTDKEIQAEIQAVMRQITSCVSFLPVLEDRCSFDLLVYTKNDTSVPTLWEQSDGRYIQNSEVVRLRSFSTSIHQINTAVAYKTN